MPKCSTATDSELVQVTSLREFFRDSLTDSLATNRVDVDHDTEHYVVNLLTLFARADAFHDPADDGARRKPLALMLADALEAPSAEERMFCLQRLGDVSLFIAGFFADSLRDSVVDIDYYVSMGGGAYSSLSMQSQRTVRGRAFSSVFAELGDKFQPLVDVLNDVRAQAAGASDADVLRQYELWLKTGSQRAARLLRENGIAPTPGAQTEWTH